MAPGTDTTQASAGKESRDLPIFPKDPIKAHEATQWKEAALARMAPGGYAAFAETGEHPSIRAIIDTPLDHPAMVELPPEHRDYERRLQTRHRAEQDNLRNNERRAELCHV